MPDDYSNLVRIEQTAASICDLEKRLTAWVAGRIAKDKQKQYSTQLASLKSVFTAVIGAIRESFKTVHPDRPRGEVYADCRLHDRRLLWMERLWGYFREKFDQRENELYKRVLQAADEVVWSCYAEPFRRAGKTPSSAPLPFIAAEYSPKAIPRKEVPRDLRANVDADFLAEMLRQLPVPVIGVPPTCVSEPWWLIYIAHEVGHHVEFDLKEDERLADEFRDIIADAAGEDGERWRQWGEEIFADAFSLAMTGPWALWALTELEWTTPTGMLDDSNVRYPSAAVRLLLMRQILNGMELNGQDALRGMDPEGLVNAAGPQVTQLEQFASDRIPLASVAKAILKSPVTDNGKTLPDVCDFDKRDHLGPLARVELWKRSLLGGAAMKPEETLRAARTVAAAGVSAWALLSQEPDKEKRSTATRTLAANLITTLMASREPLVRAAKPTHPTMAKDLTSRLASLLLETDRKVLGAW